MPRDITLTDLLTAAQTGRATALTSIGRLQPAAGEHASIAPAKYTKDKTGVYVYETRFLGGQPLRTVLVDSKSSAANRLETALQDAIIDGHSLLGKMPRVEVAYDSDGEKHVYSDLNLPHRLFDAHIRAGTVDGTLTTQYEPYIAARNSSPGDAWAILQLSPITVAFGGWDSHRKTRQARYPSLLVGEIIGVLADQDSAAPAEARYSGARVDPVAAGLAIRPDDLKKLAIDMGKGDSTKPKPSDLGFGAIPPGVTAVAGIATREIIRSHVLSFALLRRLRFGKGPEGDESVRALLAALLLNALARSDSELYLRANTHLIEAELPTVKIDLRGGEKVELAPLTIEATDELLQQAYDHAHASAGVSWEGQVLQVTGNPVVLAAADDSQENG